MYRRNTVCAPRRVRRVWKWTWFSVTKRYDQLFALITFECQVSELHAFTYTESSYICGTIFSMWQKLTISWALMTASTRKPVIHLLSPFMWQIIECKDQWQPTTCKKWKGYEGCRAGLSWGLTHSALKILAQWVRVQVILSTLAKASHISLHDHIYVRHMISRAKGKHLIPYYPHPLCLSASNHEAMFHVTVETVKFLSLLYMHTLRRTESTNWCCTFKSVVEILSYVRDLQTILQQQQK